MQAGAGRSPTTTCSGAQAISQGGTSATASDTGGIFIQAEAAYARIFCGSLAYVTGTTGSLSIMAEVAGSIALGHLVVPVATKGSGAK
jgi:hypothetical protein